MQRAAPLCAPQISSDVLASPFKKLMKAPFLLIAHCSGFMVALPHVFGITFVLVARAGAANLLLPLNSPSSFAGSGVFHLLAIILVICPIVLLLSSDQPHSARASFSSREIISLFPSCPGYLSCHTRG